VRLAPGIPCALFPGGRDCRNNSGELRRENADACCNPGPWWWGAAKRRLRTMLRIAGRTMRPPILRDARRRRAPQDEAGGDA